MSNYHLEIKIISRGKGQSIAHSMSYITGRNLSECNGKMYHHQRNDVLYCKIFQPSNAPPEYSDLQTLCDAINNAEKRRDSRTARQFIGSLPNELPLIENVKIVHKFVEHNLVSKGLCAVVAIHEGRNPDDPSKNNPHVHIIVSTRTVGPDGFSEKKAYEYNRKNWIWIWRKRWADVQNHAYERNGLDIRVTHESLKDQGVDRAPIPHLSRADWEKEQRGEHTLAGDKRREIEDRNKERMCYHQSTRERKRTWTLTR